jgi:RNA polymerase sigma-70 factor, ECF subfamily
VERALNIPPLGAAAASDRPPMVESLTLDEIYRQHAPFVWRALRRLGVPPADVEDVCQEVFTVVHRKLAAFEGRSSMRTWLYGIAVRVASSHRRRRHLTRELPSGLVIEDQASPSESPDPIERQQARAILDRLLDSLDDDKRAVFVLFELEELPMPDVAEAVGCPLQTAYSRLYAARKVFDTAVARANAQERR